MDAIFKGVFDNELTQVIEVGDFLLCLGVSLVLGLIMAAAYMWRNELVKVKTTNMGSMFRLTYNVTLRDATKEKEMIDRIRERNGNLEFMVSKQENRTAEL